MDRIISIVNEAIATGASNDDIAMLLPQGYNYTWQASMNAQAIQHMLDLRTKRDAHFDIFDVANAIYSVLPEDHKYLFTDSLHTITYKEA
jgi:thymidylate synthase (FAD)